ncbi:hypothetical protein [Niabella terrae]
MKTLRFMTLWLACLALSASAKAQQGPEDGTYFIVNLAIGRALSPVDGGINSNTRLKNFKKGGMQKWNIRKYVAKAKNGTEIISYTFQNAASGFYLRPHHVPDNGNAIVSTKDAYSSFSIDADGENFVIKNNKMGGDAMYTKNTGFSDDEPWFGADDDEAAYRWQFIPVE